MSSYVGYNEFDHCDNVVTVLKRAAAADYHDREDDVLLCMLRGSITTHEVYAKGPMHPYLETLAETCGIHKVSGYLATTNHPK